MQSELPPPSLRTGADCRTVADNLTSMMVPEIYTSSLRLNLACKKQTIQNLAIEEPRGSKYPIIKDCGSKNHTVNGFWDQSP